MVQQAQSGHNECNVVSKNESAAVVVGLGQLKPDPLAIYLVAF